MNCTDVLTLVHFFSFFLSFFFFVVVVVVVVCFTIVRSEHETVYKHCLICTDILLQAKL